jgi:hypothetical protein
MEYSGNVWIPNCTGTIISSDLILAAAHCVDGRTRDQMLVAYEAQPISIALQQNTSTAVDVMANFKTSRIEGWVANPMYGTTDYDHDLVVIKISGNIPLTFRPVMIIPPNLMSRIIKGANYPVLLLGYGLLDDLQHIESEILRKTVVPAYFEGLHLITDQTQGTGGCHGDSGGPAFLKMEGAYYLVGITQGPTLDSSGCRQKGVWNNPALETDFLNSAAQELKSNARF